MAITAVSYNQPSVPSRFQSARQGLLALKTVVQQPAAREEVSFEARYGSRIKYSSQPLYASRPIYVTRDRFEDRDVTEERNVYETRPVYTQRPVYETKVTGTRDISGFASAATAGLDEKADFSVQVDGAAASTVKFTGTNIAVTSNGVTQNFAYTAMAGSFQTALTSALGSIDHVEAQIGAGGKLILSTDNAQSLTLAEVPNGFLDVSGTALDKLGFVAGQTTAQQTGTVSEQTGTEEVLTGTETVVVGSERVKVGSEQVETGKQSYVNGSQLVEDGFESVIVGYDRVVVAGAADNLELRTKQVSLRQTLAKLVTAAQKDLSASGAVGLRVTEGISTILTMLGSEEALTGDKIESAVRRLDQARGAYMASIGAGQATSGNLFSMTA